MFDEIAEISSRDTVVVSTLESQGRGRGGDENSSPAAWIPTFTKNVKVGHPPAPQPTQAKGGLEWATRPCKGGRTGPGRLFW